MSDFSLHLKQAQGSDEWSFIVRDQTGAARLARRFFPDRLTAELSGQAAIRGMKAEQTDAAKLRAKRRAQAIARPKQRLFRPSVLRFVFRTRLSLGARRNAAAVNDAQGQGSPVSWQEGLPIVRQHLARGLSLRDALRAANENLRLAGNSVPPAAGALSTSLYDWYGRAMNAEAQAVGRH